MNKLHEGLHLEWSVNEKAALEVAAAAAYSGARAMVTMKQMGLNVRRFNRMMLILASILTSVCVAFVGACFWPFSPQDPTC